MSDSIETLLKELKDIKTLLGQCQFKIINLEEAVQDISNTDGLNSPSETAKNIIDGLVPSEE